MWMVQDLNRLAFERAEVEKLRQACPWIKGCKWRFAISGQSARLVLDADIEVHGHSYPISMTYPEVFPALPPMVYPREEGAKWSVLHQYPSGEMCLEWGSDNWLPEVSGAEMLQSFYKLMFTENPKGREGGLPAADVATRHHVTEGQLARREVYRLLITEELKGYIKELPSETVGVANIVVLYDQIAATSAIPLELKIEGMKEWQDMAVPARLRWYGSMREAVFIRTASVIDLQGLKDEQGFLTAFDGNEAAQEKLIALFKAPFGFVLLQDGQAGLKLFRLNAEKKLDVFQSLTRPSQNAALRVGPDMEKFGQKKVGIVGAGSAGSKIAVSLARSGVKNFVLIDDDLFLPENLCRHVLDWRSVGEHKVSAVKDQICLISSDARVEAFRMKLQGQESTTWVDEALTSLAGCNLVIDATANHDTLNQLATVAEQKRRPLIWLSVNAGGTGGLVGRYRPGHDASPYRMREAYNAFTAQQPKVPTEEGTEPYADGVHIATDADVSVIADHATRLALDVLAEREPSDFLHSIYLIGLRRWWIFRHAFDVIGVPTPPAEEKTSVAAAPEVVKDSAVFLNQLLDDLTDGSNTPKAA